MELNENLNHFNLSCCVACLRDDSKNLKRYEMNADVIKIYETLVNVELIQLESIEFELCVSCFRRLHNIVKFQAQCLEKIKYLIARGGRLNFDFVDVKNDDEIEIKGEELDETDNRFEEGTTAVSMSPIVVVQITDNTNVQIQEEVAEEILPKVEDHTYSIPVGSPSPVVIKIEPKPLLPKPSTAKENKEGPKVIVKQNICNFCGDVCNQNLYKHIFSIHTTPAGKDQVKCIVCDSILKKETNIVNEHFNTHSDFPAPKVCPICGIGIWKRKEYKTHVENHQKNIQNKKKMYPCDYCEDILSTPQILKKHTMIKHKGGFLCSYCQKTFSDENTYKNHISKEKQKEKYTYNCDQCDYQTKWKLVLAEHMKEKHAPSESNIICNNCGKRYASKIKFRNHFISVHVKENHLCIECGKTFGFPRCLRVHIKRFHAADTMYAQCEQCGKKMRPSSLPGHIIRVHQQIRNYKCDVCDFAFKDPQTLKRHKHTHSKTRPFTCNLCPTGYYMNLYLRDHYARVHGITYSKDEIRNVCGKKKWENLTVRERRNKKKY